MKHYVFLYPIRTHIDAARKTFGTSREDLEAAQPNINDIIEARYRENGFSIGWTLFASEGNEAVPDRRAIDPYIHPRSEDQLINVGITFTRHRIQREYPSSDHILDQLKDPEELVLGGFHQWDCVDKIAAAAHKRGIRTTIDEDTTELFFGATPRAVTIPLVRESWGLEAIFGEGEVFAQDAPVIKHMRDMRKGKPWFKAI